MVKQQSKLINSSGGEGCIFIPELPCNKKQKLREKKEEIKQKVQKKKQNYYLEIYPQVKVV